LRGFKSGVDGGTNIPAVIMKCVTHLGIQEMSNLFEAFLYHLLCKVSYGDQMN
jgi:hypothetical protein